MTLQELVAALPLKVITGNSNLETTVTGGYASDLLSNVMGQANAGNVWVTMQGHQNIVAVAVLAGLTAVIIAGGAEPDQEAIRKADNESIVLMTTELPIFEVVGRMYSLGIIGS
ncbi:MAG: DRTGG domain-containing protein [Sporomusa sp.]